MLAAVSHESQREPIRCLPEQRVQPGYAARRMRDVRPRKSVDTATLAVGFVVACVGLFLWFWPALTGSPLSGYAFSLRAWFPSWT